jgi:hypothetical protein
VHIKALVATFIVTRTSLHWPPGRELVPTTILLRSRSGPDFATLQNLASRRQGVVNVHIHEVCHVTCFGLCQHWYLMHIHNAQRADKRQAISPAHETRVGKYHHRGTCLFGKGMLTHAQHRHHSCIVQPMSCFCVPISTGTHRTDTMATHTHIPLP